jgi:threonine synthase
MIQCIDCQQTYPEDSIPYLCTACGGIYDFVENPKYNPNEVDNSPGIWRYRHTFGLPEGAPIVTLGEGDTPLVSTSFQDRDIFLKLEFLNPTHSFKDRGTAVMVSFLRSRRVGDAMDDSSGNAGSSFAAYNNSGPKRDQISAYGAKVIAIDGPRSKASEAVREAARRGRVYASHALLPHGLPGYTTTAFELMEQLGTVPGTVILPVGQGNLLLAMGRGFQMLVASGLIQQVPRLIGVQAQACAPLWAAFHYGKEGLDEIHEGETIAEGVRIRNPYRVDALLDIVKDSNGSFASISEEDILPGQRELAYRGFFVEPTSAIVWAALTQVVDHSPDPIVLVLTGSGLKAIQSH